MGNYHDLAKDKDNYDAGRPNMYGTDSPKHDQPANKKNKKSSPKKKMSY